MLNLVRFLFVFLSIFFSCVYAQDNFDSIWVDFKKDPALKNASISFSLVDLKSDSLLKFENDSVALTCASTVKLFTTATAIELLGENYAPVTSLYHNGYIKDSTLYGDIIIRGNADISMGSQYFNSEDSLSKFLVDWKNTLNKLGIKGMFGNIYADGLAFGYKGPPIGWGKSDVGNYYGAFHSGLSIYDNALRLYFKVPKNGEKASVTKVFPEIKKLTLNGSVYSANIGSDNSNIYGVPFSYDRRLSGTLPANRDTFLVKGSLPDPEMEFLSELVRVWNSLGFSMTGNVYSARSFKDTTIAYNNLKHILSFTGKTVKEIAYWTNMKSINVFAETLLSWLGYEKSGVGLTENSAQLMEEYWKTKVYSKGLSLKDGSGLSRSNKVSAATFCSLLKYMSFSKNNTVFKKTLPVAGTSGTLKSFCKGQCSEGKFIAKSGTMNSVKSYAGYITTISGRELTFALIVTNYSCGNSAIVKKMEPVMNAIYQLK
ncbi:MAG: D-alanyl-D-alanine carboxypeptidase/D-alanyl-D-alanine-endopeptidase [Crocinitomicaceae bacterium]|nr:D-alanyl-D-alanine carboxypeptidase/D-alanyl-D-alanine-endopeptidase [Crocinitomicaceae bacterium]